MLLTAHVQVDLTKRRRERTGSYPDRRGNGRSVQLVHFVGNLVFGSHISTRTVIRRLHHHQGMRARRLITRPQLTLRHMIIWGGLLAHGDGSTGLMKVVFSYALPTVVQGFGANETLHFRTTTFWAQLLLGWGVTVWGCFSFDCKLDLYVLDGNLTGQTYRDNVLARRVVPHFDNHALADRPMFMDDNTRPHRARIVQHCLQQEAVQTIPWPAMSPDMNPIEHVSDFIGRKINQRNPKCQNIDELRTAILQEWQQFPQERLRRLVQSMTRRVTELHNKRSEYTRY